MIQLCSTIDIIAYQTDFEAVLPMQRRDGSDKPAPILITFAEPHVRSAILRKKFKLANIEKYASVFINMDEPIEVRRAKAILRRIDFKPGKMGDPSSLGMIGYELMRMNTELPTWKGSLKNTKPTLINRRLHVLPQRPPNQARQTPRLK